MDAKTHHWSSWILPKCWSPGKKVIQELPLKLTKKKKRASTISQCFLFWKSSPVQKTPVISLRAHSLLKPKTSEMISPSEQ
jgi:hypothetical protein